MMFYTFGNFIASGLTYLYSATKSQLAFERILPVYLKGGCLSLFLSKQILPSRDIY